MKIEICPDCYAGNCVTHGVRNGLKTDVTDVTRNKKRVWPEVKLVMDLIASAAMIYYATHPDCLDNLGDKVKPYWAKMRHQLSVWAAQRSIRTLPETEE